MNWKPKTTNTSCFKTFLKNQKPCNHDRETMIVFSFAAVLLEHQSLKKTKKPRKPQVSSFPVRFLWEQRRHNEGV